MFIEHYSIYYVPELNIFRAQHLRAKSKNVQKHIFAQTLWNHFCPKDLFQLIDDVTSVLFYHLLRESWHYFTNICIHPKQVITRAVDWWNFWLLEIFEEILQLIGDVKRLSPSGVRWRNTFHSSEGGAPTGSSDLRREQVNSDFI